MALWIAWALQSGNSLVELSLGLEWERVATLAPSRHRERLQLSLNEDIIIFHQNKKELCGSGLMKWFVGRQTLAKACMELTQRHVQALLTCLE